MRIAFDVSPLSHEPTGIGNYIRGSLAALAEVSAGEHEIVAFAPTSPAGLRRIPQELAGIPVTTKLRLLPFAHHWRQAWSRAGRPAIERFLGPIDVLHYTDWMFPPQRSGLRSTMIHDLVPLHHREWVTRRTYSMHSAKYRDASRCDTVFVNSKYTRDDVIDTLQLDPARVYVAPPGVDDVFEPAGERADLGAPYVLTVATLEPRKNLQVLVAAQQLLGSRLQLAVVGGAGWGEQPALDAPGIHLLGRQSNDDLARLYRGAAVVAYPSRFEGFGIPIVEAMASGVPVVASSHPSLDEAAGAAALRVGPDDAEALGRHAARSRRPARRARPARPRAREAVHLAPGRRDDARGVEGAVMKVAYDVAPLVLDNAGTARYVRGVRDALRQRSDVALREVTWGGSGRATAAVRDVAWYPLLLPVHARSSDVLHCTTFRAPLRAPLPVLVTVHDLAIVRHPELFTAWTRLYARTLLLPVLRSATRVLAVSEFTKNEIVELAGVPADRIDVAYNAASPVFTPDGVAATGDYVLAVGTLEPRKNLARLIEATGRLGLELRIAGARGWGRVDIDARHVRWLGRPCDDELAEQLRGALCLAYPSLLRRLRHPGARGDALRHAGSDERRERDGRGRRHCGRARRPARRRLDRRRDRTGARPAR